MVSGAFATVLSPVPDERFDGEGVLLAISVDGDELAGRQQLLSVPFAQVHPPQPIASNPGVPDATALKTCDAEGKGLCPLEALVACDHLQPTQTTGRRSSGYRSPRSVL